MHTQWLYKITWIVLSCFLVNSGAKASSNVNIKGYYWFDNQDELKQFSPGVFEIDTKSLNDGFHKLNTFIQSENDLSPTYTQLFLKKHVTIGETYTANVYVDGKLNSTKKINTVSNSLTLDEDMSSLGLGIHSIKVQLVGSSGIVSDFYEGLFYRVPTNVQLSAVKGYYYIDGNFAGETAATSFGQSFQLTPDLSNLTPGIHSITAFVAGADGIATNPTTAWFVKASSIKSYSYWINDDMSTFTHHEVNNDGSDFNLAELIDMPELDFLSRNCTLTLDGGLPTLYARNRYSMIFSDSENQTHTIKDSEYTDIRVKRSVDKTITLNDNGLTSVETMAENEVRVFEFTGEKGDSIGIRLLSGGMYELYDPSGACITRVRGIETTDYISHTLNVPGKYYMTVHDLSNGIINTDIDFVHVGRFALLSITPETTANEGILCIKVEGNGFSSAKSVNLVSEDGECHGVGKFDADDNYNLFILSNLDEIPLPNGKYRVAVTFEDKETCSFETILSDRYLTVENGNESVNIDVQVITPLIARTPYEVYVDVTNNSNRSCWGIPVNFAVEKFDDEFKIEFLDVEIPLSDQEEDDEPPLYQTENLLGTGRPGVFMPLMVPYLAPGQTFRFTLGLTTKAHQTVDMYAWSGTPWSEEARRAARGEYDNDDLSVAKESNITTLRDVAVNAYKWYLEHPDDFDESSSSKLKTRTATVAYIYNSVANIAMSGFGIWHSPFTNASNVFSGRFDYNTKDFLSGFQWSTSGTVKYSHKTVRKGNSKSATRSASALCAGAKNLNKPTGSVLGATLYGAPKASNPSPAPTPTNVDCYQSGDPNDMTGYIDPSGSNFIGIGVKTINYTIGFENDPEIANASASRIVISDKIDNKTLDLTTLRPTKLILSGKEADLPAKHHFVKTIDMRPNIYAVAELNFDYDSTTGNAVWKLRSLDPLTLEQTDLIDSGILPVNNSTGRGQGYLLFDVDLKSNLSDATKISNKATIVFDDNDPIDTPEWINIIDYSTPTAQIIDASSNDNRNFNISVSGSDNGSGIWYYDLYLRKDASSQWAIVKSKIEDDDFEYNSPSDLSGAEFAVVAVDRAGNVQSVAFLTNSPGDADGNGTVDANDIVVIVNYYTGKTTNLNLSNADVNNDGAIDAQDVLSTNNIYLTTGSK